MDFINSSIIFYDEIAEDQFIHNSEIQGNNKNILEESNYSPEDILNQEQFEDLNDFICQICLYVSKNPVECVKCEKIFCKNCSDEWTRDQQSCPNCRNKYPDDNKFFKQLSKYARLIYEKLQIKCHNDECSQTIQLKNRKNHYDSCSFELLQCPNKYCTQKLKKNELDGHSKNCKYKSIPCLYCINMFSPCELNQHILVCSENKKTCQQCQQTFQHEDFLIHQEKCCIVNCNRCGTLIQKEQYDIHKNSQGCACLTYSIQKKIITKYKISQKKIAQDLMDLKRRINRGKLISNDIIIQRIDNIIGRCYKKIKVKNKFINIQTVELKEFQKNQKILRNKTILIDEDSYLSQEMFVDEIIDQNLGEEVEVGDEYQSVNLSFDSDNQLVNNYKQINQDKSFDKQSDNMSNHSNKISQKPNDLNAIRQISIKQQDDQDINVLKDLVLQIDEYNQEQNQQFCSKEQQNDVTNIKDNQENIQIQYEEPSYYIYSQEYLEEGDDSQMINLGEQQIQRDQNENEEQQEEEQEEVKEQFREQIQNDQNGSGQYKYPLQNLQQLMARNQQERLHSQFKLNINHYLPLANNYRLFYLNNQNYLESELEDIELNKNQIQQNGFLDFNKDL